MEIKKAIIIILLTTYTVFGQNTKLDTLRQFQGHWVFKMAINPDFTEEELAKTYPEHGHKIHIQGTRIYGNFMGMYENLSLNLATLESNGDKCFMCNFDKRDSIALQKSRVYSQPWMGIYQFHSPRLPLPYLSIQLLLTQKYLKVGIDQTMFLLERDKAEYLFCKEDNVNLNITPNVLSFNSLKKDEEVEVLFRQKEWVKVRYWGKVLLEGWVKATQLTNKSAEPTFWNIFQKNIIYKNIKINKAFINNEKYQRTGMFLIKGDKVEVLKESGQWLHIKYFQKQKKMYISGFLKKTELD